MKNVHLLPTDKLIKSAGDLVKDKYGSIHIFTKNDGKEYGKTTIKLNIYITSDEEIKEEDWIYGLFNGGVILRSKYNIPKHTQDYLEFGLKIILTTDPDLIADGVQAIDDEFLEWFVRNPSCEEVKVEEVYPLTCCIQKEGKTKMNSGCMERNRCMNYKIIIPQEEPKDVVLGYKTSLDAQMLDKIELEEPKQKTLEEAAEHDWIYNEFGFEEGYNPKRCIDGAIQKPKFINGFIKGAKWQAERMYSKEEVIAIVEKSRETGLTAEYLLLTDQFKKK
jgi:hypothetical protein